MKNKILYTVETLKKLISEHEKYEVLEKESAAAANFNKYEEMSDEEFLNGLNRQYEWLNSLPAATKCKYSNWQENVVYDYVLGFELNQEINKLKSFLIDNCQKFIGVSFKPEQVKINLSLSNQFIDLIISQKPSILKDLIKI